MTTKQYGDWGEKLLDWYCECHSHKVLKFDDDTAFHRDHKLGIDRTIIVDGKKLDVDAKYRVKGKKVDVFGNLFLETFEFWSRQPYRQESKASHYFFCDAPPGITKQQFFDKYIDRCELISIEEYWRNNLFPTQQKQQQFFRKLETMKRFHFYKRAKNGKLEEAIQNFITELEQSIYPKKKISIELFEKQKQITFAIVDRE